MSYIRIKSSLPVSFCCLFFVSKVSVFRYLFYCTAVGDKCRVAAVKRFPVIHHSADYIFISFGITEPILVTLKTEYCLSLSQCRVCVWGGGWGEEGWGGGWGGRRG